MRPFAIALAATVLAAASTTSFAQQQGVTKDEIVIGTIQDLSGPIAAFGKQTRGGMVLRVIGPPPIPSGSIVPVM